MKNKGKKAAVLSLTLAVLLSFPAFASKKSIEINVDHDAIDSPGAGISFFPGFEIEDADENDLTFESDASDVRDADPTVPFTLRFRLHSEDEDLDEDLKVFGTGARKTYVDYVTLDGSEARGRLMIYPFYQLTTPQVSIDYAKKKLTWNAVPYAGNYEVVVSRKNKNGEEKITHYRTDKTERSIATEINSSEDGTVAAAVRALATTEEGYEKATVDASGTAHWDVISGCENYRVRIEYTNSAGRKMKHEETVNGTSKNVSVYVSSAKAGGNDLSISVRAVPKLNDSKYFNIAPSDFGYAVQNGWQPDTSDYEIDDVWEFIGDYEAVVDGNFAGAVTRNSSLPTGADGTWQRSGWRWSYLVDGTAFNAGWKKVGGSWYYFDPDGYMHTGWLTDQGRKYYLNTSVGANCGVMLTGEQNIAGTSYHFGTDGALQP